MHQCWSFLYISIKMALVCLVGIYLLLIIKPYFFMQISAHRITVDLSYKMDSKVMKWITAREYELKISKGFRNDGNDSIWIQSDEVFMATHTGTHLDAPAHFAKNKWSVADIPLENLLERPLCLVDVVDQAQKTRDYLATIEDMKHYEEMYGKIPPKSVVIIRTGWSNFWPNKLDYFGTDTNDTKLAHFPGLSPDAAKWLVQERQVVGVGIDGPSIDCGQCLKKSHITLNEANVYMLENIEKSVFKVPNVGATITILPMKLADASGCPVRPIAQFMHQHSDTNHSGRLNPSKTMFLIILMSFIIAIFLY